MSSFDPRRANVIEEESSAIPWITRIPPGELVWGGIAAEDMGLGDLKRFPKREISYAGIPLQTEDPASVSEPRAQGVYKAMIAANYKKYGGMLLSAVHIGEALKRTRSGIVKIAVGAGGAEDDGVTADHLVMCDNSDSYGDLGDVVQQVEVHKLTEALGGAAADETIEFTYPAGCWKAVKLLNAKIITLAGAVVSLTRIDPDDANPGVDEISLQKATSDVDHWDVKIGTATLDGDLLIITMRFADDCVKPWTVGKALKDAAARTGPDTPTEAERTQVELM